MTVWIIVQKINIIILITYIITRDIPKVKYDPFATQES
jgi:hypothetical protein